MFSWLIKIGLIVLGVWLFHRLCLWMEKKGWIYYKKNPSGGGMGNALQELNALMRPSVKHVQEAKKETREEAGKDKP